MYIFLITYINQIYEPIEKAFSSKQFEPIKLQGLERKTLSAHCLRNQAFMLDTLQKTTPASTSEIYLYATLRQIKGLTPILEDIPSVD